MGNIQISFMEKSDIQESANVLSVAMLDAKPIPGTRQVVASFRKQGLEVRAGEAGHVHIQHQHVRCRFGRHALHLPAVAGFGDDTNIWLFVKHAHNASAHDRVVIGD